MAALHPLHRSRARRFYGTALIADEIDDKTITYLFTRPIPRSAALLGKYVAYVACTILLVLPSVVLVFFSGGADRRRLDCGGVSVACRGPWHARGGLVAYGAVFAFVGARVKRPLTAGLVFAFGWEPVVLLFPGYLKRLTVAYYLQALVTHQMPQDSTVAVLMQAFQRRRRSRRPYRAGGDRERDAVARRAYRRTARYVLEQ